MGIGRRWTFGAGKQTACPLPFLLSYFLAIRFSSKKSWASRERGDSIATLPYFLLPSIYLSILDRLFVYGSPPLVLRLPFSTGRKPFDWRHLKVVDGKVAVDASFLSVR
ncbi:hypothetical protein L1049_022527 [Liquidambar formosana]|uniref:Uncharacterized protein n=1 Tax=Liquidambar formosana TaxID=63359 RepID=A0AAP0RCK7_LIQFO